MLRSDARARRTRHACCCRSPGTIMRLRRKDSPTRSIAEAPKPKAATLDEPVNSLRYGLDPYRGGIGSLASLSKSASGRPTASRATTCPTKENRPPEAWRAATLEAGASSDRLGTKVREREHSNRMILAPLGRASVRLGAMTPEARVGRLLSGAGLLVSARDVEERSGIGPGLASTLLDLALTPVRERSERRARATLFDPPRRSNDDPLS
jgi:hypothetical protein